MNSNDLIEQIHRANMAKREQERQEADAAKRQGARALARQLREPSAKGSLWPRISTAAATAAIICGVGFGLLKQPKPEADSPVAVLTTHDKPIIYPTANAPQEPTASPADKPRQISTDNPVVICENSCDIEEVLQQLEATLSSLN